MANKTLARIKKNGMYYTPSDLAEFLAKPLLNDKNVKIFDPAYGEGALLLAAEKILRQKYKARSVGNMLYGYDKAPLNGLLQHLPYSNLTQADFFSIKADQKYDVILMNPPYVRHHTISYSNINKYQRVTASLCKLKNTSDLWAYFLVQAVGHLNRSGSIGAIIPWSFLQASYAQPLRDWLCKRFAQLKVLALGADYFDNVQERVVIVWMQGHGTPAQSIKIAFSQHIDEKIKYVDLSREQWSGQSVIFSERHDLEKILADFVSKYGFVSFQEVANVKIGVVTGADDYFILKQLDAKKLGFSKGSLTPILSTARNLAGFSLNGSVVPKNLLTLNPRYKNHAKYIRKGRRLQYHLRAHSLRRKPWYKIDAGTEPDAFFPYRAHIIPHLTLNNKGILCTNSIHRIYFKRLSEEEIKWVQLSLLAVPGQLSLESQSKNYGSGVLKVEPMSLKEALIYRSKSKTINPIYNRINNLLQQNRRVDAMSEATKFLNDYIGMSKRVSNIAASALSELQQRRLERK